MYVLSKFCCLCFARNCYLNNFNEILMNKLLFIILNKSIEIPVHVDKFVCAKCTDTLDLTFHFQQMCLKNLKKLNDYVSQLKNIPKTSDVNIQDVGRFKQNVKEMKKYTEIIKGKPNGTGNKDKEIVKGKGSKDKEVVKGKDSKDKEIVKGKSSKVGDKITENNVEMNEKDSTLDEEETDKASKEGNEIIKDDMDTEVIGKEENMVTGTEKDTKTTEEATKINYDNFEINNHSSDKNLPLPKKGTTKPKKTRKMNKIKALEQVFIKDKTSTNKKKSLSPAKETIEELKENKHKVVEETEINNDNLTHLLEDKDSSNLNCDIDEFEESVDDLTNLSSKETSASSKKPSPTYGKYPKSNCNHKGTFVCSTCGKHCITKNGLIRHLKSHKAKSHVCSACGKYFENKRNHKCHSGKYACGICGRRCISQIGLQNHTMYHTITKTHPCSICGKSFVTNFQLNAHVNGHHKSEIKCSTCDKRCNTYTDLATHMHTHPDERTCSICNNIFENSSVLCEHIGTHTKHYTCSTCGKNFVSRPNFNSHKQIHKKNARKYS